MLKACLYRELAQSVRAWSGQLPLLGHDEALLPGEW
jgi:hypothetical protein